MLFVWKKVGVKKKKKGPVHKYLCKHVDKYTFMNRYLVTG